MRYMMFVQALIVSLTMTGCATYKMTQSAPVTTDTINIQYTDEELSGWSDLPMGTYSVPDSQVIISGHQKGGDAGLLFGVIGVVIQGAVNSSDGEESVENLENSLKVTLTPLAQELTKKLISKKELENRFTTSGHDSGQVLSITSAVIITYVNDTDVRPYVILKASLTDSTSSKTVWTTRYIASSGTPHPLAGEQSFTSDQGALLKSTIAIALEQSIKFMLEDISSPKIRDDAKLTIVQGYFPYMKPKLEVVGYTVAEDEKFIAFAPKIGDAVVFTGVNIIDKSAAVYRVATKDDPIFTILTAP
jgi:uncharacterized protein YceK